MNENTSENQTHPLWLKLALQFLEATTTPANAEFLARAQALVIPPEYHTLTLHSFINEVLVHADRVLYIADSSKKAASLRVLLNKAIFYHSSTAAQYRANLKLTGKDRLRNRYNPYSDDMRKAYQALSKERSIKTEIACLLVWATERQLETESGIVGFLEATHRVLSTSDRPLLTCVLLSMKDFEPARQQQAA